MKIISVTNSFAGLALASTLGTMLLLGGGCATKPVAPQKYVFFPGLPDPPRLQFLVSYSSEKELGGSDSGFATFITGEKRADRQIGKPYGLAMSGGKLYVCDSSSQSILILDMEKRRISNLQPPEEAGFSEPLNLSLAADGTRYVVDDRRNQVICLDAADQLKWILGHKDEMLPRDVTLSGDRLYVSDVKAHCIRVYDRASQKPLFVIPNAKDAGNSAAIVLMPSNIAAGDKGQLYVSDTAAGRVQIYDRDGNYLRSLSGFGDDPQNGLLKRPKGVAVDRNGIVYVVDAAYQLVQMFDDQGRYLMCFGYPGSSGIAGMTLPAKVIIDYDDVKYFEQYASPKFQVEYLVIVSNQFGPHKIAVYGFGHAK